MTTANYGPYGIATKEDLANPHVINRPFNGEPDELLQSNLTEASNRQRAKHMRRISEWKAIQSKAGS